MYRDKRSVTRTGTPNVKRELASLVAQMYTTGISYESAVREFKRRYLLEVLARHRGNQSKAAEELGMHRNTLSRTLTEFNMNSATIRAGLKRPAGSERPTLSNLQSISRVR
jgi:Fis family transcriptional regulator